MKVNFKLLRIILDVLVVLLATLALVLFIAIFWNFFDWPGKGSINDWLGISNLETKITWETINQALFGLVLIVGIYVAYRRALALEETAHAQHDANEQKMFSEATENLGHQTASVRLGGIYALDRLARSNEGYLVSIVEILCAHLRETTQQSNDEEKDGEEGKREDEKRDKKKYTEKHKDKPSNEIQSLLEVLSGLNQFSKEKQKDKQSKPVCLNLSGAYLVRINLRNAYLKGANLIGTNLQKVSLVQAQLQGADLSRAQLQEAKLQGAQMEKAKLRKTQLQRARLQGTFLRNAEMQGADLREAQMQGARLQRAQMQGADLREAQMQGARLQRAQMQGADLREAQMQGADLREAQMQGTAIEGMQVQGAELNNVDLRGAYVPSVVDPLNSPERIRERQGKPTDLQNTVTFKGGLKQEDVQRIENQLTKCQENGWMKKEEKEKISATLKEHQDKPITIPLPSGIRTGSYDKEEADEIIKNIRKQWPA